MNRENNLQTELLSWLPIGSANPITRTDLCVLTGHSDREIRSQLHLLKKKVPIINCGQGYYIPDMEQAKDRLELAQYVLQEEHRMESIDSALQVARKVLHTAKNRKEKEKCHV